MREPHVPGGDIYWAGTNGRGGEERPRKNQRLVDAVQLEKRAESERCGDWLWERGLGWVEGDKEKKIRTTVTT